MPRRIHWRFLTFLTNLRFPQIQIDFGQAEAINSNISKAKENFAKIQEIAVVTDTIGVYKVKTANTFGFCAAWVAMGYVLIRCQAGKSCLSEAGSATERCGGGS